MQYAKNIILLTLALFTYGASADTHTINNDITPQHSTYLVGTYTEADHQGIELLSFNEDLMLLSSNVIASGFKDPSFVISNRARTLIFAAESTANGRVSTFRFNQNQQKLTLLNTVQSYGDHPCYIALDHSENFLAVANYASGNFSIYEIDKGGKLHFKQSVEHRGSSINKNRQNSAHVHSMVFHPNGKQLLVADLGTDRIYVYNVNFANTKPLTPSIPADFKVAAGSGPRHMVLHPNGKVLYVVHELTGEIGVYFYENGVITHAATHALTTSAFKGHVQAAEMRISPDGKFFYVSNRGSANDISVFQVDPEGYLRLIQQVSTGGKTPRNFTLSLDGHYLLAANQESDEIRVFKRDMLTGELKLTSAKLSINKPVYLFPFR